MADLDGLSAEKQKEYYTDTEQTVPKFFSKRFSPI